MRYYSDDALGSLLAGKDHRAQKEFDFRILPFAFPNPFLPGPV